MHDATTAKPTMIKVVSRPQCVFGHTIRVIPNDSWALNHMNSYEGALTREIDDILRQPPIRVVNATVRRHIVESPAVKV
jgi:hypothetical protein